MRSVSRTGAPWARHNMRQGELRFPSAGKLAPSEPDGGERPPADAPKAKPESEEKA